MRSKNCFFHMVQQRSLPMKAVVFRSEQHIMPSDVNACSTLMCNAEESDIRVWLHVVHSAGYTKLLCSPDTDVYT